MDFVSALKAFTIELSAATLVGLVLLLYIQQKLKDKASKSELITLKNEILKSLEKKLKTTQEVMEHTIQNFQLVFDTQIEKIEGIFDARINAIKESLKEKRE